MRNISGLYVKLMAAAALVVVLCMVAASLPAVNGEISCQEGLAALFPCQAYLVGAGPPQPPPPCCISLANLNNRASDTPTRRSLCQCFKDAAKSMKIDYGRAEKLPSLCHIPLGGISIKPDIDCTKISP